MSAEDIRQEATVPRIVSLPEDRANEYVDGTLEMISIATNPLAFQDRGIVYAEHPVDVPGLNGFPRLRVRYARLGSETKMYFDYLISDAKTGQEVEVASMILRCVDSNKQEYILEHRYVMPEYGRKKGIGSQLYQQAEDWLRQIATRLGKPITVLAGVSQYDVLTWLTKHGYTPQEESAALYQDIMENVGVTDKYQLQGDTDEGWYAPYTILENDPDKERGDDAIRLVLKKVIQPGS